MIEGAVLGGRYRLEGRLGEGAMGQVWRAIDLVLPRTVAIKVMTSLGGFGGRARRRFVEEARVGARLRHPNLTVVHDVGEHGGQPFIVMELLEGEDLAHVIADHRSGLPIDAVVRYALHLAEGLAAAHRHGVVHRDVKPGNVMVVDGRAKLCDFGIARVIEEGPIEGTRQIGSPPYLAPEQFSGRVDTRADLYSLGCVIYEMCAGERPFIGTPRQLSHQHMNCEPERLRVRRPEIPARLEDLVVRLMGKDPASRPQTADEVVSDLKAVRAALRELAPGRRATHREEIGNSTGTRREYEPVSLGLLRAGTPKRSRTAENERVVGSLREALRAVGADATVGSFVRGPVVSRYEVRMGPTATVERIRGIVPRLKEVLGDVTFLPKMRATASLPDVPSVGFEVVNHDRDLVSVGDVLREAAPAEGRLAIGIGRAASGAVIADLGSLPHLLVAGKAGKDIASVLNAVLMSLLVHAGPEEARLILVDPVGSYGLVRYSGLPHLYGVIGEDVGSAIAAIADVRRELERRYDDLGAAGCRTLDEYNVRVAKGETPAPAPRFGTIEKAGHPPVVLVVAELGGPMGLAAQGVGDDLARIARLGRAVGVHLVVTTNTLDEPTLPRRLRAEVPARLVLATDSVVESRLLLAMPGAERLLDGGDAFYHRRGQGSPLRLQCASPAPGDLEDVIAHWRRVPA
ncbi:hypothetical protein GCM10022221_07220 [Actinocorallia aurea]